MKLDLDSLFKKIAASKDEFAKEHLAALLSTESKGKNLKEEEKSASFWLKDISVSMKGKKKSIKTFSSHKRMPHIFDEGALEKLDELNDKDLYQKIDDTKKLWKLLVKKSIQCLRYYDRREPFLEQQDKVPVVYGDEEIDKYFDSFVEFERLLYGSSPYYRDHLVHTIHVWILGLEQLLGDENLIDGLKNSLLNDIESHLDGQTTTTTRLEILNMWTLAALCHDLGYPLEKSRKIIDRTQDILNHFIKNAQIPFSVNFTGIQNEMNSIIVKAMSSKLRFSPVQKESEESHSDNKKEKEEFLVRIQPKYFLKFATSLEQYDHGIISALILYKLLMYFKESELAMNEDYALNEEGARQFYIRREILRAISAHTCTDIYHMSSYSLPFLLHVCDDMHSWDRKNFREMHTGIHTNIQPNSKFVEYTKENVQIHDLVSYADFTDDDMSVFFDYLCALMRELQKRYRDGPDTKNRKFSFKREFTIRQRQDGQEGFDGLIVTLCIPNSTAAHITYSIKHHFNDKTDAINSCIKALNETQPFRIELDEAPAK